MKPETASMRCMALPYAFLILMLCAFQLTIAQQSSIFTIDGWVPGVSPISTGINSNIITMSYGDSLHTSINFQGVPDDGLGTDYDNIAFMNFSYTYTIYLTPAGSTFPALSIPVGTHIVSASQSCSSGTVSPWAIGCDAQAAVSSDSTTMSIPDGISGCVAPGDYHVDVVVNSYIVSTGGPNAPAIQLLWSGYSGAASGVTTVTTPAMANTPLMALVPDTAYLLSALAYIHIAKPLSCPIPVLTLDTAHTGSATVSATYTGQCTGDPCSYLWSDGETAATATHLINGSSYTVTVTTPCGATASASVAASHHLSLPVWHSGEASAQNNHLTPINSPALNILIDSNNINRSIVNIDKGIANKKISKNIAVDNNGQNPIAITAYPNPATNFIAFKVNVDMGNSYLLRIMDIAGKEVIIPTEYNTDALSIDVSAWPAGIYIYELAAGQTIRGKFIKQ